MVSACNHDDYSNAFNEFMYFQIITSIDDSPLDYLFSNIMILVIKFKYLNEKENEWKTSYSGYAKIMT